MLTAGLLGNWTLWPHPLIAQFDNAFLGGSLASKKVSERHLEDGGGGGENASSPLIHLPVVIWLERSVLVQAQVLGLLVAQLRQVRVERWEVQAGHILVWGAGEQRGWGKQGEESVNTLQVS